jgi:hypothetical protein
MTEEDQKLVKEVADIVERELALCESEEERLAVYLEFFDALYASCNSDEERQELQAIWDNLREKLVRTHFDITKVQ